MSSNGLLDTRIQNSIPLTKRRKHIYHECIQFHSVSINSYFPTLSWSPPFHTLPQSLCLHTWFVYNSWQAARRPASEYVSLPWKRGASFPSKHYATQRLLQEEAASHPCPEAGRTWLWSRQSRCESTFSARALEDWQFKRNNNWIIKKLNWKR